MDRAEPIVPRDTAPRTDVKLRDAFVPKLFSTLQSYDRAQLTSDAIAGVIVGVVALPLAIAFAIASGVTPDRGLWTAIVAGFLISALGGSRVQIGGPTGAFVVIVYAIVQKYGIDGLTVATLMAGVILVAMGLAKFGSAIKFIPHPLVIGFTSAIAVIIFSGEVKDFLGLRMGDGACALSREVGRVRGGDQDGLSDRRRRVRRVTRDHSALAAREPPHAGSLRRTRRDDRRRRAAASARGDDRLTLRRHRGGGTSPTLSASHARAGDVARGSGVHHRVARSGRVAALGRRRRRDDRWPASFEHGARGARRRKYRVAALWRHSGHRRDRAHGDEREEWRAHAGCRNDSRTHAAGDHRRGWTMGGVHPNGHARSDSRGGCVPHERMAHFPRRASIAEE